MGPEIKKGKKRRGVFEPVTDRCRREVLAILCDAKEPMALADVAIELTRRLDTAPEKKWENAERLQIKLYHWHVPKLEEAGLIRYDKQRNTVSLTDAASEIGKSRRPGLSEGNPMDLTS